MSKNWWKVQYKDQAGKALILKIVEVKDAVARAKELRAQGFVVDVISAVKAYPPQKNSGPRPSAKHYWCPYCIKYRVFRYMAIRRHGLKGPEDMRCPVCLISDHDYNIRKYNGMLESIDMQKLYELENAFQRS